MCKRTCVVCGDKYNFHLRGLKNEYCVCRKCFKKAKSTEEQYAKYIDLCNKYTNASTNISKREQIEYKLVKLFNDVFVRSAFSEDNKLLTGKTNGLITKDIIDEARDIISGCRDYGSAEDSFASIADYWNVYNDHKIHNALIESELDFTPHDIAMMMVLFKVARNEFKKKRDNYVDMIGYTALASKL